MIGGRAKAGLPVKLQFTLGENQIVVSGVVKGVNFDQTRNRSLLHLQASPSSATVRNRILAYVYNLFGERETVVAGRRPEPQARKTEGIVIKSSPPAEKAIPDTSLPELPED